MKHIICFDSLPLSPSPTPQNGTLQELIDHMQQAGQPLNETKILELFLSVCRGLQSMHMCSTGAIAHRDIKVSRRLVCVHVFNLPPLVLKARHPVMALPFALDYLGWKCPNRHWVGYS